MPGLLEHDQFVEDRQVSVAAIPTISLAKLNEKDSAEIEKLQQAASEIGFFNLDLRFDAIGKGILADIPFLYTVSKNYFTQAQEVKLRDTREDISPSQDLGYKSSSCDETFEISWDAMSTIGTSFLPQVLRDYGDAIERFSTGCHKASFSMLHALSPDFMTHHRATQPSNTGLKFIAEPSLAKVADVGDHTHTDGGTLTMLFYDAWGLQSYLPAVEKWAFIAPKDGCVVVNVADSLQRFSGGRYHSPKHRITQIGDGAAERYYLSYFLRPEDALMNG